MAAEQVIAWKPLGELLVDRGLLTVDQLDDALEEQTRTGERLGAILVARKIVAGAVLTTLLAEQVGVELETQGGFGSGLFSKIARRNGPAALDDDEQRSAAATYAGDDALLHEAAAAMEDPAFELSALRAELEMLRARNAQLETELASLKAKKPASRRRATSTSKTKSKSTA